MISSKYWSALRNALEKAKKRSCWELLVVAALLPLLENVFTAAVFSTEGIARGVLALGLLFLGALHLILGYLVFAGQAACPQGLIADAVELDGKYQEQQKELFRRETTYRLVRQAFDKLNLQTCSINQFESHTQHQSTDARWCLGGFRKGLEPIFEPFIERIDLTLGVKSLKFTLEAWFEQSAVPIIGKVDCVKGGLCQHFFIAPVVDRYATLRLPEQSLPALLGWRAGKPYEHHIDSDRQLFYDGDGVRTDIYFRRYAVCPITWACSAEPLGVLVLTSMQGEPFAEDVLDILAFFATLISRYHVAYLECFNSRAHQSEGDADSPTISTG